MKIVLAIDNSAFSEAAAQAVIDEIKPQNTEVRVLTVVDLLNYFTSEDAAKSYIPQIENIRRERLKTAENLVERIAARLKAAGFKATQAISEGDPRARIVESAEEWGANLIVVGSHGAKGFERALVGSVSEGVARYAKCSVQIVRIASGQ
jgi:nucleotide-binding universal stress UspA family protein